MSTSANDIANMVAHVHGFAGEFATAIDPMFNALDQGRPIEPSTMCPPVRQAIARMRRVMDAAEQMLDALEK